MCSRAATPWRGQNWNGRRGKPCPILGESDSRSRAGGLTHSVDYDVAIAVFRPSPSPSGDPLHRAILTKPLHRRGATAVRTNERQISHLDRLNNQHESVPIQAVELPVLCGFPFAEDVVAAAVMRPDGTMWDFDSYPCSLSHQERHRSPQNWPKIRPLAGQLTGVHISLK